MMTRAHLAILVFSVAPGLALANGDYWATVALEPWVAVPVNRLVDYVPPPQYRGSYGAVQPPSPKTLASADACRVSNEKGEVSISISCLSVFEH